MSDAVAGGRAVLERASDRKSASGVMRHRVEREQMNGARRALRRVAEFAATFDAAMPRRGTLAFFARCTCRLPPLISPR